MMHAARMDLSTSDDDLLGGGGAPVWRSRGEPVKGWPHAASDLDSPIEGSDACKDHTLYYFLLQNRSPQFGHSSSMVPPSHQLPFLVSPVLWYAEIGMGSPHTSHGFVTTRCQRS